MQHQPTDDITDLVVAYALNALEPEEMARVGALLDESPELRQLLAELKATTGLLPYGLPEAAPPSDIRQRVLDHATGKAPRVPAAVKGAPALSLGNRLRGWLFALGGFAVAALLALAVTLGQLNGARSELAQAQEQLAALSAERLALTQAVASANTLVRLNGPEGEGVVLRSASGEDVLMAMLPALDEDQVYQLWTIAAQDTAPESAGLFTVDSSGFAMFIIEPGAVQQGVTLAVTTEPSGGSPGPTTDVVIAGVLS